MSETARRFREAVLSQDVEALEQLLAEDVVFRSPAVHQPYTGRLATMVVLRSVIRVFEDFAYTRSYSEDGGGAHVLEFEARVGDRRLQGVDVLEVGEGGLVVALTVILRPLSALNAVVARMQQVIPEVTEEMGLPG